jgi:hypothetical protein
MALVRCLVGVVCMACFACSEGRSTLQDGGAAGESGPGGAGGTGTGGIGGAGGTGGAPGGVRLSTATFGVGSSLYGHLFIENPWIPSGFHAVLLESDEGCSYFTQEGPGSRSLDVLVRNTAVGDCRVVSKRAFWDAGPDDGCLALVLVMNPSDDDGWWLVAKEGTVRVDHFGDGTVLGEVRARFPVNGRKEECFEVTATGEDGIPHLVEAWCECTVLGGTTERCDLPIDRPWFGGCCNQGLPLEEVRIPLDVGSCPAVYDAGTYYWSQAPIQAACRPDDPAPAVDCVAACAGIADACTSCASEFGCGADPGCLEALGCPELTSEGCRARCVEQLAEPGIAPILTCLQTPEPTCSSVWECFEEVCHLPPDDGRR